MPSPPRARANGASGFRVEEASELHKHRRVENCAVILVPLEDGAVVVDLGEPAPTRVDRTSFALVPGGFQYRVEALVPMTRLATIPLDAPARGRACKEYHGYVTAARFDDLLGTPRILPRTRWVDEVVQRYVFERIVCEKHGSMAALFLETEIAKEVFFLTKEREEERTRTTVVEEGATSRDGREPGSTKTSSRRCVPLTSPVIATPVSRPFYASSNGSSGRRPRSMRENAGSRPPCSS
jgi:hypothetical protein